MYEIVVIWKEKKSRKITICKTIKKFSSHFVFNIYNKEHNNSMPKDKGKMKDKGKKKRIEKTKQNGSIETSFTDQVNDETKICCFSW